jgi:hypothetical protein
MRTHAEASEIHGPKFEVRVYESMLRNPKFIKVRKATYSEQTEGHFDIYAEAQTSKGVSVLRIECKSIKDNRDDLLLVEGRTVCSRNGGWTHPGWLFGKATHLACERASGITWVPMSALRAYVVSQNIDWTIIPQTKKEIGKVRTRTSGRENDPMIVEKVLSGGVEIEMETRGDRVVYFQMSEVEKQAGVYWSRE